MKRCKNFLTKSKGWAEKEARFVRKPWITDIFWMDRGPFHHRIERMMVFMKMWAFPFLFFIFSYLFSYTVAFGLPCLHFRCTGRYINIQWRLVINLDYYTFISRWLTHSPEGSCPLKQNAMGFGHHLNHGSVHFLELHIWWVWKIVGRLPNEKR